MREINQFGGFAGFSTPIKQYGGYFQDDWYLNDRWTFYLGFRYDYWDGFDLDQSGEPDLSGAVDADAVHRAVPARLPGRRRISRTTTTTTRPASASPGTSRETRRQILRGGYGTFYDFPYTNATILFPSVAVQSDYGTVYNLVNNAGIRNPDGSFYRVGQPFPPGGAGGGADPPNEVASPNIATPYSDQISARLLVAGQPDGRAQLRGDHHRLSRPPVPLPRQRDPGLERRAAGTHAIPPDR